MRIAFISYEYPPDTAFGGIATYVQQAAKMLMARGHHVEIIAGSSEEPRSYGDEGVLVHTVKSDAASFPIGAGELFAERHKSVRFDVLEGPEFGADASEAVRHVPDIPLVVKLHTSLSLMRTISVPAIPWVNRVRIRLGAWRRGRRPGWETDPSKDVECAHTLQADEIAAPCKSIAEVMRREWKLDPDLISLVPLPYVPSERLLSIPCGSGNTDNVLFLGRLELRKGVVELAKAVRLVARRLPGVRFRFVGADQPGPGGGGSMIDHMKSLMGPYAPCAEFSGAVPMNEVSNVLSTASVCVYPSHWENFPLVCLEAMAAGRAVIGSEAGGMAEMLDGGRCGILIRPFRPQLIAEQIIRVLSDPETARTMGERARARILSDYSAERIARLQEDSYRRAIARRAALGPRPTAAHFSNV